MNGSATQIENVGSPTREWGYLEATVLMTGLTLGFMTLQMARPTPLGTMGVRGASALIFYPLIMALAVGAFPRRDSTRSHSNLDLAATCAITTVTAYQPSIWSTAHV